MTLIEFIGKLKKLNKQKWTIGPLKEIRCGKGDCPIQAVFRAEYGYRASFELASIQLGISPQLMWHIIDAADNCCIRKQCKKEIRQQILEVLKLKRSIRDKNDYTKM